MDVSIIIVNYKTACLLANAVESIFDKTTGVDFEVIVVDNASGDNCGSLLARKFEGRVTYVGLKENIGFGRANNEGARLAKGRNLFFLNPDTILLNNAVKLLSNYLDAHSGTGACGGSLYDERMSPAHSLIRLFPSVAYELDSLLGGYPLKLKYGRNYQFNHSGKPLDVAYTLGADLMVKRAVWDQTEGFDKRFFMFFEETDLCFRIRKNGWEIKSVPTAEIQHLESKSFADTVDENRIFLFETGRKIFYTIHYSQGYRKVADVLYGWSIDIHLFLTKCLSNKRGHTFWKMKKNAFNIVKSMS